MACLVWPRFALPAFQHCRQKCQHFCSTWLRTVATLPGSQAAGMTHGPCPAAPEGPAKEVTVSRICRHWKAEDRRAKPGFVLISGNNHTRPRLPPTCFPFSELLMLTREPAQEDFSHKDPRAAGRWRWGYRALPSPHRVPRDRVHSNNSSSNSNIHDNLQFLKSRCMGARHILSAPATTYHMPRSWGRIESPQ